MSFTFGLIALPFNTSIKILGDSNGIKIGKNTTIGTNTTTNKNSNFQTTHNNKNSFPVNEEDEYITFDEDKRREFLTGFHKRKMERKQKTIDRINKRIKLEEQEARKEKIKSERSSKLKVLHTLEHIEKVKKVIEGAPLNTLNSDSESDEEEENIEKIENTTEEKKEFETPTMTSDDTHKKNIESISEYKGNKTLTTVTTVSGFDISNPLEAFEDEINDINGGQKSNKSYENTYEDDDDNNNTTTKHRIRRLTIFIESSDDRKVKAFYNYITKDIEINSENTSKKILIPLRGICVEVIKNENSNPNEINNYQNFIFNVIRELNIYLFSKTFSAKARHSDIKIDKDNNDIDNENFLVNEKKNIWIMNNPTGQTLSDCCYYLIRLMKNEKNRKCTWCMCFVGWL